MYLIELDEVFWIQGFGETDENEETPIQVTTDRSKAMQFASRQEADNINTRFGLGGEIRDIV